MNDKQILNNAPKRAKGIKIFDGFYRWFMDDNTYSKIHDHEGFNDVVQIERSLHDIEELVELKAKLGLVT